MRVRIMKRNRFYVYHIAMLSAIVLLASLMVIPSANAQRRRVYVARSYGARMVATPSHPYPVVVGGRRFFYSGGYFYRGGRRGYFMVTAPLGARIRVLPYGFWSFNVGPVPYYCFGGVYYQYIPDENIYVVVQKPNGAPSSPPAANDTEDRATLTDGTTVSGTFVGADADSVHFEVNGQLQSISISKVTSINFAPSTIDTTGGK